MTPPRTYAHWIAVATIASVAIFYGGGFAAMQIALRSGLTVGAALALRFVLSAIGMGVLLLIRREPLTRRAVLDGIFLGLLLVTIFWLQTDGLRFTTTSKSGFITSLYIPFTPLLAIVLRDRVRLGHAIAALLATLGLFMLVHVPGGLLSGWNRGRLRDFTVRRFVCRTFDSDGALLAQVERMGAGVDADGGDRSGLGSHHSVSAGAEWVPGSGNSATQSSCNRDPCLHGSVQHDVRVLGTEHDAGISVLDRGCGRFLP
jgi:hypothetical protein